MDLGKRSRMVAEELARSSTPELLERLSSGVRERRSSWVEEWIGIVDWADRNVVDSPDGAATLTDGFLDTGVPIAGPGAPLVSEFGLMELIATLERTPDSGRAYVGRVIEAAWRLPRIYAQVVAGKCSTWRAEQVAALTHAISAQAARWVDAQLAFAVGTCTWAQVERLVAEAVVRFDPELAETQREEVADHRHFDIDIDAASINGLVPVHGLMDAADAGDFDDAIARRATLMGKLGHEGSLDVRRSEAVGEMARQDLMLDLEVVDTDTGEITIASPGRKAEVHVHITDTTLAGENPVGRNEATMSPVMAEQIRQWLQKCGTVIVRPVIDLNGHVPVDSYEIPDRLRRQVALRDHTCRFPGCGRRATRCDVDHAKPHTDGGPTCPCNLVLLCRRHHRAKTHSGWRYAIVEPGTYLWTSPNSRHFLVDHRGTRALDPPRRLDPPTLDGLHDYETDWSFVHVTPACPGSFETRKRAPQPPDE